MFRLLAYYFTDKPTKQNIIQDMNRYLKWDNCGKLSNSKKLRLCMKQYDFLGVYHYRIANSSMPSLIFEKLGNIFRPYPKTIEIGGVIQGGLFISHNSCVVFPKQAGTNLRIGPGVVIGRAGDDYPVIGNNVYIAANSTVIGNITIGDNVIIGAGSVVTKNIPNNSVVIGNPARVIRNITEADYNEIM